MVARWAEYLTTFNCDIKHVEGVDNVVADVLSRAPQRVYCNVVTFFPKDQSFAAIRAAMPDDPFAVSVLSATHPNPSLYTIKGRLTGS